jgi:hypothetical protein
VWQCIPVIPALERLRQNDYEFEASLSYMSRPCFKIKEKEETDTGRVTYTHWLSWRKVV